MLTATTRSSVSNKKPYYYAVTSTETKALAAAYQEELIAGKQVPGEDFQAALAQSWINTQDESDKSRYQELLNSHLWCRRSEEKKEVVNDREIARDNAVHYPYAGKASGFWKVLAEKKVVVEEKKLTTTENSPLAAWIRSFSPEELVRLLLNVRRPSMGSESRVYGDGWDVTLMEMRLLSDCSTVFMNMYAYDNGARSGSKDSKSNLYKKRYKAHQPLLPAHMIYLPSILLKNGRQQPAADCAEVVVENKDGNKELDFELFYQRYANKLLPALRSVNENLKAQDQYGFLNAPGLGAEIFAGDFDKNHIKQLLIKTFKKLITENHAALDRFKVICLDLYDESEPLCEENFAGSPITFMQAPSAKTGLEQLESPKKFIKHFRLSGKIKEDLTLVSLVAADPLAKPGCEGAGSDQYINNRSMSDDSVKALATNTYPVLLGKIGSYDEKLHICRPTEKISWKVIMMKDQFIFNPKLKIFPGSREEKKYAAVRQAHDKARDDIRDAEIKKEFVEGCSYLGIPANFPSSTDSKEYEGPSLQAIVLKWCKKYTWKVAEGYRNRNPFKPLKARIKEISAAEKRVDEKSSPLLKKALLTALKEAYAGTDILAEEINIIFNGVDTNFHPFETKETFNRFIQQLNIYAEQPPLSATFLAKPYLFEAYKTIHDMTALINQVLEIKVENYSKRQSFFSMKDELNLLFVNFILEMGSNDIDFQAEIQPWIEKLREADTLEKLQIAGQKLKDFFIHHLECWFGNIINIEVSMFRRPFPFQLTPKILHKNDSVSIFDNWTILSSRQEEAKERLCRDLLDDLERTVSPGEHPQLFIQDNTSKNHATQYDLLKAVVCNKELKYYSRTAKKTLVKIAQLVTVDVGNITNVQKHIEECRAVYKWLIRYKKNDDLFPLLITGENNSPPYYGRIADQFLEFYFGQALINLKEMKGDSLAIAVKNDLLKKKLAISATCLVKQINDEEESSSYGVPIGSSIPTNLSDHPDDCNLTHADQVFNIIESLCLMHLIVTGKACQEDVNRGIELSHDLNSDTLKSFFLLVVCAACIITLGILGGWFAIPAIMKLGLSCKIGLGLVPGAIGTASLFGTYSLWYGSRINFWKIAPEGTVLGEEKKQSETNAKKI